MSKGKSLLIFTESLQALDDWIKKFSVHPISGKSFSKFCTLA